MPDETLHFHGVGDQRPHSRACGWRNHPHGPDCSTNCPTCHGRPLYPEPPAVTATRRDALVQAVLDALSEADLRAAALYCRTTFLYDRLEAAADALHALEAEQ